MLETFNWGIIGPGSIADEFANDLRLASNARHRVGAVFSYKIDKAEDFAGEKKANEFFGSIHDFLKHASIDAAYIATPQIGRAHV